MAVPPEQPPVYPPPAGPVDQPTAPIDPVPPRQVPPRAYREDPYVDPRREAWRWEGLRTALTIVGLLALIAIGLAVWALIKANHNNGRVASGAPANTAALVALNRRVNHLESQLASIRSAGGSGAGNTQALAARVAALEAAQKQLASKVGHGGASSAPVSQLASKYSALSAKVSQWVGKEAALSGQVSGLQGHVAQIAGQVRQLQSQSGLNNTNSTTTGTTTGP